MGVFATACSLTGTIFAVDKLAQICHQSGFIAVFIAAAEVVCGELVMSGSSSYAARMSPQVIDHELSSKDALVINTHNLPGGP